METMSTQPPAPKPLATAPARQTAHHHGLHDHSAQGQSLEGSLQQAGFYPRLVADVVADALDGRDCVAHLVHLETHFDRLVSQGRADCRSRSRRMAL